EEKMRQSLNEADAIYPNRLAAIQQKRDDDLKKADSHYPPRIQARKDQHAAETKALQERIKSERDATKAAYDAAWAALVKDWTDGLASLGAIADEVNEEAARRFLDWDGKEDIG